MSKSIIASEPFRLFFPVGVIYLLCGIFLWVPQIWSSGDYPVALHRYLVLNGFTGSFIGGFLMTAVPRFSKTEHARGMEVFFFFSLTFLGMILAHLNQETFVFFVSAMQPAFLLFFLLRRIVKRRENPPYSFIFIFVGLFFWMISALASIFIDSEGFKSLHYEGAVVAIILGVGSRLIPGILGHVEIVKGQREKYETPLPILKTVPWYFFLIVMSFIASYFLEERLGSIIRAIVVGVIGFGYWKLFSRPQEQTALTWSIWLSGWCIVLSFILKGVWAEGYIHTSHAFFISGIVLLSLLIGTRVLQSHGPKDKNLENWKGIYLISFLIILSGATRVSAFIMPESYLTHLGYSAIILGIAVIVWSIKYLRFVKFY